MKRRDFVTGLTGGLSLLAGCSGLFETDQEDSDTPPTTDTSPTTQSSLPESISDSNKEILDFLDLETYTNQKHSYSVKYPAEWIPTDVEETSSFQSITMLADPSRSGFMMIQTVSDIPSAVSLDQVATKYTKLINRKFDISQNASEQSITLTNGHSAKLIESTIDTSSEPTRVKYCLTVINGTFYAVYMFIRQSVYMWAIDRRTTKIVTSLTTDV
jgi:hypothetical protein